MKVLKEGKGWSIKRKCTGNGNGGGGCGAMLLVEKDDIYMTETHDYGWGHDVYFTFRCPVCSTQTDIAESAIPSSIQDLARVKKMGSASSSGWRD